MFSENLGPPEGEAEVRERHVDAAHAAVRRVAKDLREIIQRASPHLSSRQRVLDLVEEILLLVPPRSEQLEIEDEHGRAIDRGDEEPFAEEK